jgi:hypothetical protein
MLKRRGFLNFKKIDEETMGAVIYPPGHLLSFGKSLFDRVDPGTMAIKFRSFL